MSFILRVGAVKPLGTSESLYGNGDDASTSYSDADVLDIPLPEHTYQRPLPPVYPQPQNNVSCFGLPYQDHNYGMPPPPSPPRVPSPRPPSPLQVNGVVQMEEEVKTSPLVSVVEEVVEDSITRCICGYLHDDGYMICCDKCSVWQHIDCMGVDRNCIPENYFCEICQPRTLDAVQAKILQKRKREELAARNVLSDSSATDTDPEEAANALASVGKKLPVTKKKTIKQRRNTKLKEKTSLKMKVNKAGLPTKLKKTTKKEKENIKTNKPKKVFKPGVQKRKADKSQPLLALDQTCGDPWNSTISPWIDSYEHAEESHLSPEVKTLLENPGRLSQSLEIPSSLPNKLQAQLTCVADVKKNRKGLKAMDGIPAGQAIIEYKGQVILKQEYDLILSSVNPHKSSLHPFVLFYSKLDVNLCVDAGKYGNEARFIRRSCTPNSEVQCIVSGAKIQFVIMAKKQILKGAEITIAFDYDYHISSVFVECACIRNSCAVSRYWKKKTSQKLAGKEMPVKRRRQSSGDNRKTTVEPQKVISPQGSPKKVTSPVKTIQMNSSAISPPPLTSPVKLSNVSTLLAASALLDGQLDISSDLSLPIGETPQVSFQPVAAPAPQPMPVSSRRGSRAVDEVKEEKPVISYTPVAKEKAGKIKEKVKEKEAKEPPQTAHVVGQIEIKRERRLSSRRQSQEEPEEEDQKPTISHPPENEKSDKEESTLCGEGRKKMTREERKLDAIVKAFEKLEKREERRKEAIARGDGPSKKPVSETKGKKPKDEQEESETKLPIKDDDSHDEKEVKTEPEDPPDKKPSETIDSTPPQVGPVPLPPSNVVTSVQESKPVESPQKVVRRTGKRKRRRSRVQSATVTSDTLLLSQDESSTNSTTGPIPLSSASVPSTPIPALQSTNFDLDGSEEIKYTKSKKHLFNEWSTKHETENSKQEEEMFVQCIQSSRGNAMDHLQRRNSHSAGCQRGSESSGIFAKKRWLRQAMHEVPAPANFNHSLSVATDNGSMSPIYGSVSPSPGNGLGSPGAPASPLDFVTPLKKRRLMRESLSGDGNHTLSSYGSGLLSENSVPVGSRINGFKQALSTHRHSVDDRLLLDKGTVQQNGIRESPSCQDVGLLTKATTAANVSVRLRFDSAPSESEEPQHNHSSSEHNLLDSRPVPASSAHLVNGIISNESITSASSSLSRTNMPVKLETSFAKGVTKTETTASSSHETHPSALNAEKNGLALLSPSCSNYTPQEEKSHSSMSRHVLVNSVYSGVNNLIESSSEAGCVVTKSFMEADGPATVCVDLNAHEMEPSSLSTDKAIVDLNRELFPLDSEGDRRLSEIPSDCRVNSSEDVSGVRRKGHFSSCDNPQIDISHSRASENLEEEQGQARRDGGSYQEMMEVVDSSQQVLHASVEVNAQNEPRPSSTPSSVTLPSRNELNSISSSGQSLGNLDKEENSSLGKGLDCDSMEADAECAVSCDSRSASDDRSSYVARELASDNESENIGVHQPCDSADNRVSSAPQSIEIVSHSSNVDEPMEEGDTTVSESCPSQETACVLSRSDSNVDSTSCEQVRTVRNGSPWRGNHGSSVYGQCDSNSEREPNVNGIEVSASMDDSSAEVGVSSSSALNSHTCGDVTWEDERRNEIVREALPDNAVSTISSEFSGDGSPGADVTSGTSTWTDNSPQQESSHEALPSSSLSSPSPGSVSSAVISSNLLNTPSSHSLPPIHPSTVTSIGSQEESSETNAASSGVTTSSIADQVNLSLSPVPLSSAAATSTSEAVPATKKKVSLLEYRKRLKEKPPASPVDVKSPTTTCQPTTSVTLSSVAARFLSCGASSSTLASSSSTSSSQYKKQKMPTLATLPLFKSADGTREERHSKAKRKTDKQLSLTERLRLEFGLDDCGDEATKKADWHRGIHRGGSTPPPPPPPLPPLSIGSTTLGPSTGRTVHRENGTVDSNSGSVDDGIPPPPPPGRTYPYPLPSNSAGGSCRPSSSFSVSSSSTTSRQGYHGTVVNGGPSPHPIYPQQSSISSTSVSPSHVRENNNAGYHLPVSHPAHPTAPNFHHLPQATASLSSLPIHNTPTATWSNLNTPPIYPPVSGNPQPSSTSTIQPPSRSSFDYSNMPSPHSHATVSGNSVSDEQPPPPPPPPLPPPRPHHHHSSTASSSSSHRHHSHHYHQNSSKKSKKAASSTSASSSSSHYSDKKSRF